MSLLYTVQGLRERGYDCVVGLAKPTPVMHAFYADAGFETIDWPGIRSFEHTTASWATPQRPREAWKFLRARLRGAQSRRRTLALVEAVRPDVVHLNSVVLYDSAAALISAGRPFVWHVREAPVHGLYGLRTRVLSRALLSPDCEPIFISEADRGAWVGGAAGTVIRNFVDLGRFSPEVDGRPIRASLSIPDGVPVLLYLGAAAEIKGWRPLLAALELLRDEGLEFVCLMPGTEHIPPEMLHQKVARAVLPRIGMGSHLSELEAALARAGLGTAVRRLPFEPKVDRLIAACDVMVFPSTRPHFARPVVEAAAMGRPSVASDLPGTTELVVDGETGLLVPAGAPRPLADALAKLLRDPVLRRAMGAAGRRLAEREYGAARQIDKIAAVFERSAVAAIRGR
jgi:glycosyltransferase involved in cell wall biosynthesis